MINTMIYAINLFAIFSLSLIVHVFLLVNVKLGLFGLNVRNRVNYILENKMYLFNIFVFLVSLFIIIILNNSMLYLDTTKNVLVETVSLNNNNFQISGEAANIIFNNLGSSAVFVAGARIAAALVAKHPMGIIPKIGTIGSVGAGFAISFKVINHTFDKNLFVNNKAKETFEVQIENLTIDNKLVNLNLNNQQKSFLKDEFVTDKILNLKLEESNENLHISATPEQTKSIMEQVSERNINWPNVVNSPLESNETSNPIKDFLIESLTNNLTLHFIVIYLMFMFIIIFTCKIILENNYQFNGLKQSKLGIFIHYYLIKYINLWKNSANLWLYFIGFSLFFFNLVGTYSISNTITIINNHL